MYQKIFPKIEKKVPPEDDRIIASYFRPVYVDSIRSWYLHQQLHIQKQFSALLRGESRRITKPMTPNLYKPVQKSTHLNGVIELQIRPISTQRSNRVRYSYDSLEKDFVIKF